MLSSSQVCLCGFRQLKDEDVQLLLDSCPLLNALSVADCTTLGALILSSRQLRTLDVSRCIHISKMSLDMPCECWDSDYFPFPAKSLECFVFSVRPIQYCIVGDNYIYS